MGIAERKAREKEQRREDIIDAAETLFFGKGIEATTMDDIAEKSELSKGTLYLYFRSKEDIRMAVAKRGIGILNKMSEHLRRADMRAIDKLVKLGRIFIEFSKKYPDYVKTLLFMETADFRNYSMSKEELKQTFFRESPIGLVLEFVRAGVNDGSVRRDIPPEIVANTLWSQLIGVIQFVFLKEGIFELVDFSADQLFENHLEIALNGIQA